MVADALVVSAVRAAERRLAVVREVGRRLRDLELATRADAVERRLAKGAVHVAFAGQTNRGKSSLINALIGDELMPTGIVPVTAVATHVVFGERGRACVCLHDGSERPVSAETVADYVMKGGLSDPAERATFMEGGASGPAERVAAVELYAPAELLRAGLRFIDTPGIGTDDAPAERAVESLRHADTIVLVTGADPPITPAECEVARAGAARSARVLVVMNKADALAADTAREAMRFLSAQLGRALGGAAPPVFLVSAAARRRGATTAYDWAAWSGALAALAGDAPALLASAAERETVYLVQHAVKVVHEYARRAYAPVAACDDRVEALRSAEGHMAYAALMLSEFVARTEEAQRRRVYTERRAFVLAAMGELAPELARGVRECTRVRLAARERHARRMARRLADEAAVRWATGERDLVTRALDETQDELARLVGDVTGQLGGLERLLGGVPPEPAPDDAVGSEASVAVAAPAGAPRPAQRRERLAGARRAVQAMLPARLLRRGVLRHARAELERELEARTLAAADDLMRGVATRLERAVADCQRTVRGQQLTVDWVISELKTLRESLDVAAHEELFRLAALRAELRAHLPAADGRKADGESWNGTGHSPRG